MMNNYANHLMLLAQEEKSRLFNVPPFHVILGLAAFTHIALIAPMLFMQVADAIPKTKQVRLAFGVDKETAPSNLVEEKPAAEDKTETTLPPVLMKNKPHAKQPARRETMVKNGVKNAPTLEQPSPTPSPTPSNVMIRPDRARVANLRSSGGGYKSNIAAQGEVVGRYEQLLSGWINSHRLNKMLTLPAGTSGRVVVRVRINRRGYVIFKAIEQSSNDVALDNAAIESVTRASPVPPVPAEYPGGAQLEFLIPISFVVN